MKKLITLLLAMALVFALCACGGTTTPAATEAPATEEPAAPVEETAAPAGFTTATEGYLTMATNAAFPPYEFYEGDTVVGIDAEIAQAIAEKLGLELKVDDMEFDSIIT
ncbi:MAG: transporter substrate-binding domain-containing protein, partial [Clostridia bacterium]|nr:transporter substrate-binding domain-containing protein [Clostridia bacterium]